MGISDIAVKQFVATVKGRQYSFIVGNENTLFNWMCGHHRLHKMVLSDTTGFTLLNKYTVIVNTGIVYANNIVKSFERLISDSK